MGRKGKRRSPGAEQRALAPKRRTRPGRVLTGVALAACVAGALYLLRPVRPNLLVITIDTLRADRVGAYGYAGAATPVLDALARRGARFDQALAAVPLTGPSHATIFTGQYPPVHGVRDNVAFRLDARHATLATLLKNDGYRTAAFVGAFPVASAFGFGQGFDHFGERIHQNPAGGQAERPADEVAAEVVAWLADLQDDKPFFAWAHFYDPHDPYRPPEGYRERFRERPYDGEVAFVDTQVGRVLDALEASGRGANTVLAVLSDHGEGLGEHHEATHAILIYQSTLRVPFLLAGPGVPAGQVVHGRVGLVDVLPTLLSLLGLDAPAELPGRDLGPALTGAPLAPAALYAESLFGRLNCRWSSLRAWVDGHYKLIDGAQPELYDLSRDPAEQNDLAASDPRRVQRLRRGLRAALGEMVPEGDVARAAVLSPQQEERLRSLGYASGGRAAGDLDARGLPDPRTHVPLYQALQQASVAAGPRLAQALPAVQAIVAQDPGNPLAHSTLASLAYRAGALGLAERAYARTLELDPDRVGWRKAYGKLLRDLLRFDESESQLRIAVGLTSADDHGTRISLAETLIARGDVQAAEPLLSAVLEQEPQHVEALAARGRLLLELGRSSEALEHLERAASKRAGPEPWIELARAGLRIDDARRALSAVDQALQRSPQHPWALALQGHALILDGQAAAGRALLRRAFALRPRRPQVWLDLAAAFERVGDEPRAADCRREAQALAAPR